MQGILLGAVMIVVLGVLDDIMTLHGTAEAHCADRWRPASRSTTAASIQFVSNPNVFIEHRRISTSAGWSYPVTIIWIVAITNAVNFIDGLDGLAVGVSAISTASITGHCAAWLPRRTSPLSLRRSLAPASASFPIT